MGAAAGLQVGGLNLDGPKKAGAAHFLAYSKFGELASCAVAHRHRPILEDDSVCGALCAEENVS